jgi:Xaa-Pro aminopeptidase
VNRDQAKAVCLAVECFNQLSVVPGETEKEVAAKIFAFLKRHHARPAFKIIVGSGKRTAIPHCFATNKVIQKGELIMIDLGANVNGWRSDITRTFVLGKTTSKQRRIIKIVKTAQRKAIGAIRPGVTINKIDKIARDYITQQGYGQYFIHTTGHGIGRRVHQAPKVSRHNRRRLRVGMVKTIEPGIYIKGWGGVRIEDMIEVTKQGCKVLTGVLE